MTDGEIETKDELEAILLEFCRTHVTFRPVKAELCDCGQHLRWTVEPVIHDKPVPPPDLSAYLTGDGVESPSGSMGGNNAGD